MGRNVPWMVEAALVFVACVFLALVLYDGCVEGLWIANNRRATSFADSLYSCFRYRMLTPARSKGSVEALAGRNPNRAQERRGRSFYFLQSARNSGFITIVVTALAVKFGSGTLISLALGELPVILKGSRHMVSFLLAFALLQAFPHDGLFLWLKNSRLAQVILYSACALYKLRKVLFVLFHPQCSLFLGASLALLSLEGNSLLRHVEAQRSGQRLRHALSQLIEPKNRMAVLHWLESKWWPSLATIVLLMIEHQLPQWTQAGYLSTIVGKIMHSGAFSLLLYRFLRQIEFSGNTGDTSSMKLTRQNSDVDMRQGAAAVCVVVWAFVLLHIDFQDLTGQIHALRGNLLEVELVMSEQLIRARQQCLLNVNNFQCNKF